MSTSWEDIEARARQRFPERYASNGEPLAGYPNECRHTSDEKTRGLCGDGWQHRRVAWERAQLREVAAASTSEDVEGPPIADEPEHVDEHDDDQPYARVRQGGRGDSSASNSARDYVPTQRQSAQYSDPPRARS